MDNRLLPSLTLITLVLAVSLAVVSFFGAFDPSTYGRDSASIAAQGIGQDLFNLFIVTPLLLLSLFLARTGRRSWVFIFGGSLFYIMYSFIIYAFGVNFNRLFLLYCLTLGISLYAFILFVLALTGDNVKEWFRKEAPVKLTGVFLLLVAAIFYMIWLKDVVPAILSGTPPSSVSDYNLLVNPVHVADLSFALPGLILTSWLLLKRKNYGFILAPVALVFIILLAVALVAMVAMLKVKGISDDISVAAIFSAISLISLVLLFLFLRRVQPSEKG